MFFFWPLCLLLGAASLQDNTKQLEHQISTLNHIEHVLDMQYAPVHWKAEHRGWFLNKAYHDTLEYLYEHPTLKTSDFQQLLQHLFMSCHDYHTNIYFFSSEEASLPFRIKSANSHYYIIDTTSSLENVPYSLKVGDEILSFDHKPIDEAVKELKQAICGNEANVTDQSLAEIFLTHRLKRFGHKVPQGPISIVYYPKGSRGERSIQFTWDYTPEQITTNTKTELETLVELIKRPPVFLKNNHNKPQLQFTRLRLSPLAFLLQERKNKKGDCHTLSKRESFLPRLRTPFWESPPSCPFDAYLFQTENNLKIGYLRIPHFLMDEAEAKEASLILQLFQEKSDGLIIDQLNNGGGYTFFGYALLSLLANKPLLLPKEQFILTQKEVLDSIETLKILQSIDNEWIVHKVCGKTAMGYPITLKLIKQMRQFCHFFIDQWNSGKTLTDPYYDCGLSHIEPSDNVRYTKPILLLINELNFSQSEFFASTLQENHRATILGVKSAGAGGAVSQSSFPNQMAVDCFTYTISFAIKDNGLPLEDLGVIPDLPYHYSKYDLQYDFSEFTAFILQQAEEIFKRGKN